MEISECGTDFLGFSLIPLGFLELLVKAHARSFVSGGHLRIAESFIIANLVCS
jgi:hypothetical protein